MKMDLTEAIFNIKSEKNFNDLSVEVFLHQYRENGVYRNFVNALKVNPGRISNFRDIPFLPITFFKTRKVVCGNDPAEITFLSSGTTGMERSRHFLTNISIYRRSIIEGFDFFFGSPSGCTFFALVPSREENPDSSLGFMVDLLMESAHPDSKNFFLHDFHALSEKLRSLEKGKKKVILIGLTSSLLDFGESSGGIFNEPVIIETGGMKGKKKELIREDLHKQLCRLLNVTKIHSEYGMTELLSQAYSTGDGIFRSPPWMKVLIRDINDPLSLLGPGKSGGINIIDLANLNSCSFIATQDLGRSDEKNRFEILGRFDESDVRGCNLMVI
jgi:hypothetical protein